MFKFTEKQGRLCIKIDLYLKRDLSNKELEELFNELEINIGHQLISDFGVTPVTEDNFITG